MNNDTLEKVLAYVDAHIQQRINLCDLSKIAGYSPFYFSRLFSEAIGMPVTGYIRIRKLQHAVVSLLEGHKVLDVALLYSFDSHEGFTRSFTQLFGSTPSTVRKFLTSYSVPAYVAPTISNRRIDMETTNTMDLQHNMHQLVFEVLENSLDEARAGYCTKIEVALLSGNKVKIVDNGRGLPLSKDLYASKTVLDKILTGSPITNAEYSQMGDLVQAGMQTVNSLCDTLQITVNRDGNQFQQDYIRGIAQHDLRISNAVRTSGTEIILRPDKAIFGDTVFSKEVISNWIEENSANIMNLEINVHSIDE
jgi:AraC-like DNA-binding protein